MEIHLVSKPQQQIPCSTAHGLVCKWLQLKAYKLQLLQKVNMNDFPLQPTLLLGQKMTITTSIECASVT
jgi:hypothetical protein